MGTNQMDIVFRVDAGAATGLGHLMRCLTLAQRIREKKPSIVIGFITQQLKPTLIQNIERTGCTHIVINNNTIAALIDLLELYRPRMLVIDHYGISASDEQRICSHFHGLLAVFDDMFLKHHAHIIINHGVQAMLGQYTGLVSKQARCLCGSEYTLLRDEFFSPTLPKVKPKHLAIVLGGTDPFQLSVTVVRYCRELLPDYRLTLLSSSSNPQIEQLAALDGCRLLVDCDQVAQILAAQEIIICSTSTLLFEVMALKRPFINILLADNQKSLADYLERQGIFTTINKHALSPDSIQEKLRWLAENPVYDKLDIHFSKYGAAQALLHLLSDPVR